MSFIARYLYTFWRFPGILPSQRIGWAIYDVTINSLFDWRMLVYSRARYRRDATNQGCRESAWLAEETAYFFLRRPWDFLE